MSNAGFYKCKCAHCGGRLEFPPEYVGQSIPCPHCKQQTELTAPVALQPAAVPDVSSDTDSQVTTNSVRSKGRGWIVATVVVVVLLALGGAAFLKFGGKGGATDKLQVVSWTMEPAEYKTYYLVGTVSNSSDKAFKGAEVTFDLVDALGNPSGEAVAKVESIAPHATVEFKVLTSESQSVWEAKLKGVVAR